MFEYLVSVFSGVTANGVTRIIEALWGSNVAHNIEEDIQSDNENKSIPEKIVREFQTFHIKSGFESILNFVGDPVVHMVVEDEPTTAWHLVILVVESRVTGEWYVSKKGEMAFEGSGGGLYVAENIARICRERRVPTAGWVIQKKDSDALSNGQKLWPEVKGSIIPLMSYSKNEYFVKYIAKKFSEVNT